MKVGSIVQTPMQRITTSSPFELVSMDLVSLPSSSGYMGCLVVMDHHTKWLSAVAIRYKTSATVAAAFEYRVLPFLPHWPVKVLTDNGPEFSGVKFNDVLDSYGIQHQYTTPNKPSSNGLVERANRTLIELLRIQSTSPATWYQALPRSVMVHNTTYHSAIKMFPSEYIYSKPHLFRGAVIMPSDIPERWREGHPSFGSFKHGQLVLRKSVFRGCETVDKFAERFEGPYSVIKVNLNGVTYMLKHNTTENIVKAHHSQLRRYCVPPAYIVRHPYWITLQQSDDKKHAVDEPDGWIFDRTGEANTSISLDSVEFSSGSCNSCTSTYGSDSDSLPDSHGVPVGTRSELEISDHVVTSPAVADLLGLEGDDVIPPWDLRRLKPNQGHEGCSIIPLATQLDELVHPMEMVPPVVQSESFSFEATDQLPSGLVLEGSAEFWDVSDIYSDQSAVNDASDLYSEKENPLDIELQLLTENIDLLQTILESERLSFSGFGSTDGMDYRRS